ncbi:MAG: hypothetical protein LUD29_00775 [Clostridia bacterium]|nr:hypothetical protein [Clostridia bacterium]
MLDENLISNFIDSILRMSRDPTSYGSVRLAHIVALQLIMRGQSDNEFGRYSIGDLTKSTGMAMPNVTRMLNDLQMANLIIRQRDGRHVYITVTDTGKQAYETGMEGMKVYIREFIKELNEAGLSDEELNNFLQTSIMIQNVRAKLNKKYKEQKQNLE